MKRLIVVISFVLLLSACGAEKSDTFKGRSANWEVTFTSDVYEDGSTELSSLIRYIGDGEAPDTIDYSIMSGTQGITGEDSELRFGSVKYEEGILCGNCTIIQLTDEVEAEILWDGETESISLRPSDE